MPKSKTRMFTDRDKQIYRAGLCGQQIELTNRTERLIYSCGVNQSGDILEAIARQDRIIKRQKEIISKQRHAYIGMCESMKRCNVNLWETLWEDDKEYPVHHVILSLDEAQQIQDQLRTKNFKDCNRLANLMLTRIRKVEKVQNKTAQQLYNHLMNKTGDETEE
jgi:hypothetical protein